MMLIDPPSPFSPLEEWESFRAEMEAAQMADPENEQLREYIGLATDQIAKLMEQ